MKERPILFSGPMVSAILEGRKTQTRRVIKNHPWLNGQFADEYIKMPENAAAFVCPHGIPGDRLWVRETWTSGYQYGAWGTICAADSLFIQGKRQHEKGPHFHAKEIGPHIRWRPSIFMPRWASRITLEITDVRVQRLQEISEEDAIAEGAASIDRGDGLGAGYCHSGNIEWPTALASFHHLWDSINAKRGFGWDSNPWIWALTFKAVR